MKAGKGNGSWRGRMTRLKEFEYEALQDREAVVGYLKAVCDGFSKGALRLGSEEGEILLQPSGMIKVGVQAVNKGGKVKLSIKLGWTDREEERNKAGNLYVEALEED